MTTYAISKKIFLMKCTNQKKYSNKNSYLINYSCVVFPICRYIYKQASDEFKYIIITRGHALFKYIFRYVDQLRIEFTSTELI